jgi:beta-lactamase class A
MRSILQFSFCFLPALSFCSSCDNNLDAHVRAEIKPFKGRVSIYAKNLETGAAYSLNGDERVPTASTIKLAIMVEAFARVAEGRAKWSDQIVLGKGKKQPGSGVLNELADDTPLTLRDAVNLMIAVSDNTAANLVFDVLTTDAVNARMVSLGLTKTRSLHKIGGGGESKASYDPANKDFGIGVTTPHEMVLLMEKLERGQVVSSDASRDMIALLKRQQYRRGIGRSINGVEMASKPGALDALRSDVGIIYSKRGRVAMAITCDRIPDVDWTEDNPAYHLMSRLSNILIDGLGQ